MMLLSSSANVSLIWLFALARGEIVSSTCLTARASSWGLWPLTGTLLGVTSFLTGILCRDTDLLLDSARDPFR